MAKRVADPAKKTPTYLRGRKPIKIKLHDVMDVLAMIEQHNQKEQFQEASKTLDAYVTVHPKTVNFVKDFIADHPVMSVQSLGAKVMNPGARNDPYECKF